MNGAVVVDASLVVKWLVPEVNSDKADTLARSWAQSGVRTVAPFLMPVEVTNALYQRVVRGEASIATAIAGLERLLDSGIELQEQYETHVRAIELAYQLRQGAAYDAHYLALAELLDCELWTADERFYRVASGGFPRVKWLGAFT